MELGHEKNLLQEQPRALIRHALLPKEECRVTRTGVMLKKMGYASQRGKTVDGLKMSKSRVRRK